MGIKNAGKAKIKKNLGKAPTKETVDTPMSECEAENPLECRYHGLQALEQQLSALLPAMGYKVPFGTDKLQGGKGFEIRIDGKFDVNQGEFQQSLTNAFKQQGWDLTYNGKVEGAGHSFMLKKGNAKPIETTEEDDKDKDDVDLVDDGLFDDLDDLAGLELREEAKNTASKDGDIDLMPLVGNPDALKDTDESDITLKDIEDFLAKNGTTKEHHYGDTPWEEILANWEGLIKDGKAPNGSKLEGLIDYAKGYMDTAGEDHKVTKALKAKIAEVTGEDGETKQEKKPSFEDAKDFLTKGHILEGDISDLAENIWGPIVFTGHYFHGGEVGEPWLEKFEAAIKELSDHPVTPYVKRWLNKAAEIDEAENLEVDLDELDELAGSEMSDFDAPLEEAEGEVKGDDDILKDSWSLAGVTKQKEATDKDLSDDAIKEFLVKGKYEELAKLPSTLGLMKEAILKGTMEGQPLPEITKDAMKNLIAANGENHKISKLCKKWLDTDSTAEPTDADWDEAVNIVKMSDEYKGSDFEGVKDDNALKKMLQTAGWCWSEDDSVVEFIDDNQALFKGFIKYIASVQGNDSPVVKAMVKAYKEHSDYDMYGLEDSESNEGVTDEELTAAIKDLGIKDSAVDDWKDMILTGMHNGKPLSDIGIGKLKTAFAVLSNSLSPLSGKYPNVEKKIKETLAKLGVEGFKESEAKQESPASAIIGGLDESLMKPLEHDEGKFPPNLTQKELDAAIAKGKKAGGHGGLHTTIVEIGGKKYICKNGAGKKSNIIKNGFNADMAYRAGGVYAPDAKLYEYGDGKTYKLSEFVEGQKLIDVWKNADEATRDGIRKELLKGYPLDALFSNYDVLGTSPEESQTVTITGADGKPQKTHVAFDNIIIGSDGHAYRIDNDGAFAMTGTGGHKSSGGGAYTSPVEAEQWDNWDERQWIDDFRTMRRNEKNLGIFDRYSTADIFLSAGNINLDNVASSLPEQIQKALAKPLFEMKQMTYRAVNISLGGFKNNGFVSMALDASYEASKRGLREQCQLAVSWNNSGFGKYKKYWGNYQPQPFGEKPPEPPQDPREVLQSKLKNEEYTGGKIGSIILNAAKTINHHGGVKQTDKNGNVLGNGTAMSTPDYDPSAAKIAEWEKIDREKLEELAKTDENAKTLLGLYDTIAYSKENGWKKPIGQIPTGLVISAKLDSDFKSQTEKKVLDDMAGAIKEFEAKQKQYQKELITYEQKKSEHKKKEEAKALAAGGSPYHNFHHFAEALMEEGINTDGIAHQVKTNGIAPIESSMHSQKGSSYASNAVKWKVREMMALGYTPEQILKMAEEDKLYNGSYYTSCINNSLIPNKENWDRDMNSQAMYLGMNMVKMENEKSDLYDKASGVVFLNRNIGDTPKGLTKAEEKIYNSSETGWVGPHIDSAADCMQFEKNSWGGSKKQVYAVPFSRIVCCANNDSAYGGSYGYESEQEYVGNLYELPCWVYHPSDNLTWKNAIDEAKKSNGMSGLLKKFATRLGMFNTLMEKKK